MTSKKRLPDAEFEIMKTIWRSEPPMTTAQIMERLDCGKTWKPQTVLTMLVRLIEKGFLTSVRVGRERSYDVVVSEQDYMSIETGDFVARYHGNSVGSLVKTMYDGKDLSQEDVKELMEWLKEKEKS